MNLHSWLNWQRNAVSAPLSATDTPTVPQNRLRIFAYDIDVRETVSLSRYARQHDVDAIITSFSDLLFECMVRSSDKAGLDCYLKPEQLPFYRNKMKMKQLLNSLSIATPRHVCLKRGFSDTELSELRFPAVTKPLDMYGSRGLYVLNSPRRGTPVFFPRLLDLACERNSR